MENIVSPEAAAVKIDLVQQPVEAAISKTVIAAVVINLVGVRPICIEQIRAPPKLPQLSREIPKIVVTLSDEQYSAGRIFFTSNECHGVG